MERSPTAATHEPFSQGFQEVRAQDLLALLLRARAQCLCMFVMCMLLWPFDSAIAKQAVTSGFSNASVVEMVVLVLRDINFWTRLNPLPLGVLRQSSKDIKTPLSPHFYTVDSAFPLHCHIMVS